MGEVDGEAYHFVSRETFRGMIRDQAFAEWAEVFGDYYGTSFRELEEKTGRGLDVIMDLDIQGALNLQQTLSSCVLVFLLPPSMEVLEQRLRDRGTDDEAALAGRIARASTEIGYATRYDYLIVNDRLERAVEEASAVLRADRCRTRRRLPELRARFDLNP